MSWLKDLFGTEKPIIAMCHLDPLPGDPSYDAARGLPWILERARRNLRALQEAAWMPSCSPTRRAFPT